MPKTPIDKYHNAFPLEQQIRLARRRFAVEPITAET
jgi:hypothetical protein